jgi:UDP-glucose 4-epimerase
MASLRERVLVTGGAGFIGSELVSQLLECDFDVTVVDNLATGKAANLAGLDRRKMQFVPADIRDLSTIERLLDGVSIVYHLACLGVRHSLHAPVENHDVNATGTLGLLSAARQARVPRFVYVSSSEVYGTAQTAPMTEAHPTFPMTVYGASKLAGECYARAFFRSYDYPTVMVRPFNSFGPRSHHEGDSGEVIPKFMLRAMVALPMVIHGDGTQTRDFSFVSDTARAILRAGIEEAAIGKTFNVGSGSEITISELARTIAAVVGRPDSAIEHSSPRPGDVLRLCADSHFARKVLDVSPRVSLKEGLQRLHAWYRKSDRSVEEMLAEERINNWTPVAAE